MDGYLGTIMMCGLNFAPRNWVTCEGQSMSIQQNAALYSLLGVAFGGDARNTFGIPDLRGRVPVGTGRGPNLTNRDIGKFFGMEASNQTLTLNQNQMPVHTHSLNEKESGKSFNVSSSATLYGSKTQSNAQTPENAFFAPTTSGPKKYESYATTQDTTMNSAAVDVKTSGTLNVTNLEIGSAGGTQPITFPIQLAQPSLVLRFVICTSGLYPSRT
jgi:microcystin-dependent protein